VQVRFRTSADGTVIGACHLPTAAGAVITVAGIGDSRTEALANAARVAEHIASDEVLAEYVADNTLAAIVAAKGLAAASAQGPRTLRSIARGCPPGARRLAAELAKDHGTPTEVGIGPLAVFAAEAARRYGPKVASELVKKYKERRAKQAAAKKAAAQRARQERIREDEDGEGEDGEGPAQLEGADNGEVLQ
jgi:hypothetical protein